MADSQEKIYSEKLVPKKIGIVVFNLGGPNKSEDIRPFLKNLFSDPVIISLPFFLRVIVANLISTTRAPKAKPLYDLMGGFSPLLKNTKNQTEALEKELKSRLPESEIKIFISMRYWDPLSKATAKEVEEFAPDEVVLLPLYPHYSCTTTGSSVKEWQKYYKKPCRLIRDYPTLEGLVVANYQAIMNEYVKIGAPQKIRILFSAHGLPQKIVDAGDPYEKQINETANKIKELLPDNFETVVCYQSKVGPLKWLTPSTPDEIKRAAKDNIGIIICPIAFVSDHIETLVELDVEYKEEAHNLGLPFFGRSATVNTNEQFIKGLADLVVDKLNGANV